MKKKTPGMNRNVSSVGQLRRERATSESEPHLLMDITGAEKAPRLSASRAGKVGIK